MLLCVEFSRYINILGILHIHTEWFIQNYGLMIFITLFKWIIVMYKDFKLKLKIIILKEKWF